MQVASDYFDRELAWQMFTLACGYAQGLQLHQVDREDRPQSLIDGKPILDRHREGFWNLSKYCHNSTVCDILHCSSSVNFSSFA